MERKIIVKNGDKYDLLNLVIDEEDFYYTKYYVDNLPCMYNYLDGGIRYDSFEDCVQKLNYDYKKKPTFLSIHLNRLLDNDNPLIVSDAVNKLVHFKSNASLDMIIQEGLLEHFSITKPDIDSINILPDDYMDDDSNKDLVPVSMEDLKESLKDRVFDGSITK